MTVEARDRMASKKLAAGGGSLNKLNEQGKRFYHYLRHTASQKGTYFTHVTALKYARLLGELGEIYQAYFDGAFPYESEAATEKFKQLSEIDEFVPALHVGNKIAKNFSELNDLSNRTYSALIRAYEQYVKVDASQIDTLYIEYEINEQLDNELAEKVENSVVEIKTKIKKLAIYEQRDIPVMVDKKTVSYKRDSNVAAESVIRANYECELNNDHHTFTSMTTGENFVEAHHIVPISQQSGFDYSLDVIGNVVALCPNCHRLIHNAKNDEKIAALDKLLTQRKVKLHLSGIDVGKNDLLEYYLIQPR